MIIKKTHSVKIERSFAGRFPRIVIRRFVTRFGALLFADALMRRILRNATSNYVLTDMEGSYEIVGDNWRYKVTTE